MYGRLGFLDGQIILSKGFAVVYSEVSDFEVNCLYCSATGFALCSQLSTRSFSLLHVLVEDTVAYCL